MESFVTSEVIMLEIRNFHQILTTLLYRINSILIRK